MEHTSAYAGRLADAVNREASATSRAIRPVPNSYGGFDYTLGRLTARVTVQDGEAEEATVWLLCGGMIVGEARFNHIPPELIARVAIGSLTSEQDAAL